MASYKSSRLTKGNLFFPDTIETKEGYLIYNKRKLFGSNETSLNYNKITAVSLKNGIIFSSATIETGGSISIGVNGLKKSSAKTLKSEIENKM